jgi:cytolysin-activating lysine-acyltransferase
VTDRLPNALKNSGSQGAGREPSYLGALGAICSVMMRSPIYCQYPIACLAEWIRPAVLLDQYCLLSDASGNTVGYMTWAFLAEDTEKRFIGDTSVLLHLSEWNEGDRLWIMDFVVLNSDVRHFLKIARTLFPGQAEATSLRRRDDGSVSKVTHWRIKKHDLSN